MASTNPLDYQLEARTEFTTYWAALGVAKTALEACVLAETNAWNTAIAAKMDPMPPNVDKQSVRSLLTQTAMYILDTPAAPPPGPPSTSNPSFYPAWDIQAAAAYAAAGI